MGRISQGPLGPMGPHEPNGPQGANGPRVPLRLDEKPFWGCVAEFWGDGLGGRHTDLLFKQVKIH